MESLSASEVKNEKASSTVLVLSCLERELLVALRGQSDALSLSRELGYSYNQWSRWERGKVSLKWIDFVRVCELKKIPLGDLFFEVLGFRSRDLSQGAQLVRELSQYVVGPYSYREVCLRTGLPFESFERWIYRRAEPPFQAILQILHSSTQQSFFAWLSRVVRLELLPSAVGLGLDAKNTQSLEVAFPYAALIEGALRLEAYLRQPHSTQVIAELSGLPVDLIEQTLPFLERAENIRWDGSHFRVLRPIINMQGLSRSEICSLARYWNQHSLNRFLPAEPKGQGPSLFSLRVAPLSQESVQKILGVLLKCHNEISAIVDGDQGPFEELRVFVTNFYSPDENNPK